MGAPRGLNWNTKDVLNKRLRSAAQEARYAPEAWVRPHTVDQADSSATAVTINGPVWSGFYLMRLRGVVNDITVDSVLVVGVAVGTSKITAVLCEYSDDGVLRVREVTRGVSPTRLVRLGTPVTLDPVRKYAVAIGADVDAASSLALNGAPAGVVIHAALPTSETPINFEWTGENLAGGIETQGPPTASPVFALMLASSDNTNLFNIRSWY